MNRIQITERALHLAGNGTVRIHPAIDHTNYGYWFPQELLPKILPKNIVDEINKDEYPPRTIDIEVSDEALELIKKEGINPYAK